MNEPDVTKLEIDILLIFYNFCDQYGNVDTHRAAHWAKQKLGVSIKEEPFKLEQEHLDLLMDAKRVPDIRELMERVFEPWKSQ